MSHGKMKVKIFFGWTSVFAGRKVARVEDWRWWEDHICKFELFLVNVCCIHTGTHLNCAVVYYSMFETFRVERLPRAIGNRYRSMHIVIFERECVVVVCKAYAVR
jgi:hypothetical protein